MALRLGYCLAVGQSLLGVRVGRHSSKGISAHGFPVFVHWLWSVCCSSKSCPSLTSVVPLRRLVLGNVRACVLLKAGLPGREVQGMPVDWGCGFMETPEEAEQYHANEAEVLNLEHMHWDHLKGFRPDPQSF